MFTYAHRYGVLVEWDGRESMMDGTTGRLRIGDEVIEFTQHRQSSMVQVANGPLYYGSEWYTVGKRRYENFGDMVEAERAKRAAMPPPASGR